MSFNTIPMLSAALALVVALTGMAWPVSAWARIEKPKKLPYISNYEHPNKTDLELMQLGKDMIERDKIHALAKAKEITECGQLTVNSQPGSAEVLVNSYVPLGNTPYVNDKLLPGLHRVTVRKKGYYEQVRMVDIIASQRSSLDFRLKPIPYAHLTVKVRPLSTRVRIINFEETYTPGMKLVPGRYLLSFSHHMYGEQRMCAVLGDNQELTLNVDLADHSGGIRIESNPSDVTVYLDGREPPRNTFLDPLADLPPGPHLVQVWKSLFKPISKVVQVQRCKETKVRFNLTPAEHFTNSVGMEFVEIPAGEFMMGFMGSPEYIAEHIRDWLGAYRERKHYFYRRLFKNFPQHLVQITKSLYMQTTEVTNSQWDKVMGTVSHEDDGDVPKSYVNVIEVKEFIAKLNQLGKGKYRYRLPTEAEWEYAARAGTQGLFYTGNCITTDQANFGGASTIPLNRFYGKTRGQPIKVKSFPPNPWGLYDMYGNVFELCSDRFDVFYFTRSPVNDPMCTKQENGYYVARGGCFISDWLRCLCREPQFKNDKLIYYGFRLVAEKVAAKQ